MRPLPLPRRHRAPGGRSARPTPVVALAATLTAGLTTAALALAGPATASPLVAADSPAAAPRAAAAAAAPNGYASTIALNNCSGALVRFPSSVPGDRAMLLTNGHCYEGGMPGAGVVLVNRSSSRAGQLLNAAGSSLGTVRADQLLYATMTGTDVALYRLTDTFAALSSRYGATALTVQSSRPADGTAVVIPSSYWKQTYTCTINGFVGTLREGDWTFHDSVRYNFPGCNPIHGTSGSPILDAATSAVVGINNTGNDDGQACTVNNPCEVDENGQTHVQKGQSYGQQTYWFTTCLTAANAIDLTRAGCLLTKPAGTPTQTPTGTPTSTPTGTPTSTGTPTTPPSGQNVLVNPGFESGSGVGWTGTDGPITTNSGRPARTGSWKMWLGGNGTRTTETESQTVTVPSTGSPTLSFWMRSDTSESGSTVYDTMKVQVVSGGSTTTLATYSNASTSSTYAQKSFDLSAYKGRSVTIRFTMSEDSYLQTSWVVDDTSLS